MTNLGLQESIIIILVIVLIFSGKRMGKLSTKLKKTQGELKDLKKEKTQKTSD